MQFVLDHLSAVIISSVILLILVVLQARGSLSTIETHIADSVHKEMIEMHKMLEWDISKITSPSQTDLAFAEGRHFGTSGAFLCQQTDSANMTASFSFPALDIPYGTADSTLNVDSLFVIDIRYQLAHGGDSLLMSSGGLEQMIPVFRLYRFANDTLTGFTAANITDFQIKHASRGAGPGGFVSASGNCPAQMSKIRYSFGIAQQGVGYVTNDQKSTAQLNKSRFGLTVDLINW